jgi:hypothetical protein
MSDIPRQYHISYPSWISRTYRRASLDDNDYQSQPSFGTLIANASTMPGHISVIALFSPQSWVHNANDYQ